eukprot:Amastigsp_a177846_15.p2 type:complete len:203 gc:universal Amastigsp_a177846_15:1153-545(-)
MYLRHRGHGLQFVSIQLIVAFSSLMTLFQSRSCAQVSGMWHSWTQRVQNRKPQAHVASAAISNLTALEQPGAGHQATVWFEATKSRSMYDWYLEKISGLQSSLTTDSWTGSVQPSPMHVSESTSPSRIFTERNPSQQALQNRCPQATAVVSMRGTFSAAQIRHMSSGNPASPAGVEAAALPALAVADSSQPTSLSAASGDSV